MDARARVRARHLDYVSGLNADGRVVMAGPFADGTGALVVYRVEDVAEVRRLIGDDPYTAEGVTVDGRLREWNVVVPPVP